MSTHVTIAETATHRASERIKKLTPLRYGMMITLNMSTGGKTALVLTSQSFHLGGGGGIARTGPSNQLWKVGVCSSSVSWVNNADWAPQWVQVNESSQLRAASSPSKR
jgi:hypothetical protein